MNDHEISHDGSDPRSVSDEAVHALWQWACSEHIQPSHLFRLALGLAAPLLEDADHLACCAKCWSVFERYRSSAVPIDEACSDALAPHPIIEGVTPKEDGLSVTSVGGGRPQLSLFEGLDLDPQSPAVPDVLRDNLSVEGPVLFPNGEVAFRTWQLGRLEQFFRTKPAIADSILTLVTDRACQLLVPQLARRNIVLVCFGQAVHRLGTRLGGSLLEQGFSHLHVVLAHDFYSPALVCAPYELRDADVTVIIDVLHTGGLLDRLLTVCRGHNPARLRGLAVIGQSVGNRLSEDRFCLWTDEPEERIPIDEFRRTAGSEQQRQLLRFEPNAECAVGIPAALPVPLPEPSNAQPMECDATFVEMIKEAGALRCDYKIGRKRYPYVINILDLLGHPECRNTLASMASDRLADLASERTCLAYDAGRAARAGRLAKTLALALHWPVLRLGTRSTSFAITEQQCQQLAGFRNVVIVDAAIRTGDSLTAIIQALQASVHSGTNIVAFCVLDALSRTSRLDLASHLRIDIRTLFEVALAPPTERVRSWMNSQKARIRDALCRSGRFSDLEPILRSYCEYVRRPHNRKKGRLSPDETPAVLEKAVSQARTAERAADYIGAACQQGKVALIQHLPLDLVVHDRSLQSLLLGVMYNSMKPSIKEGAVFALGAARNYDWISYDWLQCNRPFLGSRTNSWKSVLMVVCQMKLEGMTEDLARIRDALGRFATKLPPPRSPISQLRDAKELFSYCSDGRSSRNESYRKPAVRRREERLRERVQLLINVTR
jgi:hypoxanthine-guanine phosphoribosyltransferase